MKGEKKKIYFGWYIVVVCFFMFFLVYSGGFNLAGIFINPISEEYGISATAATTSMSLLFFGAMLGTPIAGNILQKFSIRKVSAIMLVVISLTYFGAALTNSIYVQYVLSTIRGIAMTGVMTIPISILMTNWFGKKIKGKAFAIVVIGSGIGTMILNPVTGYIIDNLSYRVAYNIYAVMTLVMVIPVILTFIRKPEDIGLKRIGDDPNEEKLAGGGTPGLKQGFAVRTVMFWSMMMVFVLICTVSQNWMVNGYTYLADLGYSATRSGTIFMVCSLGITLGKAFFGFFNDKFGSKRTWLMCGGLYCLSYSIIIIASYTNSLGIIYAGSAIMGFSSGAIILMMPLSAADQFGSKHFAPIYSYLEAASTFASSFLPLSMTGIYDSTGSFVPAWFISIGMAALMIVFVFITYGVKNRTYIKAEKAGVLKHNMDSDVKSNR